MGREGIWLCVNEDLSSNQQHPHKAKHGSMSACNPNTLAGKETAGALELAGCQSSKRAEQT